MRRLSACLLVAVSIAALILPGPRTWAQQPEVAGQRDAAEFAQLYARWQQTQDPEDKIAFGEQLLARESALKAWPLSQVRERVKGELLFDIGYAYVARRQGSAADNVEQAIAHLEAALTVFTRQAFPEDWALTRHNLGSVYWGRIRGERAENVEKAIAHLEAALEVRTRETNPQDWAQTQNSLGIAYSRRVRGEPAENLEKAIAAHQGALTVSTRDASPQAWAANQIGLGFAYANRINGDRADNQESSIAHYEAALAVYTREAFPREWALAQIGLGKAYSDRTRGERADNLEKAIAHDEAVLTAFTREASPREWAQAQSSLGLAYQQRLRGERADNLEKAIAAHEEALTVMTREGFPHEWATIQNNLGHAYSNRIRGERGGNVEKAIASYQAALSVRTREAFPLDWAGTQSELAGTYLGRVRGEQADNVESAIAAAEAALTVYTREAYPQAWALAQNTLGIALWRRSRGDPAENQEKAIAAAEAALTIFTRETSPQGWAVLQSLLGLAYANRPRGLQADNLQKAVAHLEAALTFYSRQAFPRDRLRTTIMLGNAHTKAGDWPKAGLAYADARDTLLMLQGEGAGEAEARSLVADTRFLFPAAAYAAAQRGEGAAALALASEGRARLLAAALRLQTLELPDDRRHRLDELRAAIRAGESALETAQGAERAAAVDKLAALRGELLAIVKSAGPSASASASILAQARTLAAAGGAVVVAVLTKDGGKLLIVTSRSPLAVLDLPDLTTDRLDRLLRGDHPAGEPGGWLGAYNINYLNPGEQDRRWPEWIGAIEALGPELWRMLGATLDAALKERGVKPGARLIWLPTDALGILPLGLAQDPASKRRLADTYQIVYAPSLEALTTAQAQIARGAAPTLAAVVNPTGDLPGTEKEGALIASYFGGRARTLLEKSAATPEAVRVALKGRTHWHFASHGSFSWEDARASALVMHNFAPLSVGRLLETDGLGRPRLVVLSACETGLYDIDRNPDEFVGLPGAFTALGAAGVVGTLWPVSDAATALLMAKFYELHMGAKMPPPVALWRAQLWLRQATNADLQTYARLAATRGRMGTRHIAEIERELSEEGLTRSRNAPAIEWIAPDAARAAAKNRKPSDAVRRLARPYAHPYFWGGFIYTGL